MAACTDVDAQRCRAQAKGTSQCAQCDGRIDLERQAKSEYGRARRIDQQTSGDAFANQCLAQRHQMGRAGTRDVFFKAGRAARGNRPATGRTLATSPIASRSQCRAKASERRLSRRARELEAPPDDQFVHLVDTLEAGAWIEFIRHNGVPAAFRLVWVSPLRSRFIFCNRQSGEPFSFTAEELAVALREQGASLIPHEALSTRALLAALQDMDESD